MVPTKIINVQLIQSIILLQMYLTFFSFTCLPLGSLSSLNTHQMIMKLNIERYDTSIMINPTKHPKLRNM
jgi:hypothetical protein